MASTTTVTSALAAEGRSTLTTTQLATGTATSGYVPVSDGAGSAAWAAAGGGWSSDGSKTTTTLLVRIGAATPPTLYNAYWLAAARDDGASCASGNATFSDTAANGSIRNIFRARGTSAEPKPVQTSDTIGIDQWSVRNAAGSTQTVGRRVHTVSSTSFTTHPGDVETLELRAADATSNTTIYTASPSSWAFAVPVAFTTIRQPINVLTDGPTVPIDCSLSNVHTVTLQGNRTLTLTNDSDGQRFTLIIKQDGTGSRTVTWWSGIEWKSDSGSPPTLTTAANSRTVVTFLRVASGDYIGWAV